MSNLVGGQRSELRGHEETEEEMIGRVKRKIAGKIQNVIGSAVKREIDGMLPIISQLIEYQNSGKEDRQSYYDHTKDPLKNKGFYASLKDRLLANGVPVQEVCVDITDFEMWLEDLPEIRNGYAKMDDVFVEKCLEHYLTYTHLKIRDNDVYIDVGAEGSKWADTLNRRGTGFRGRRSENEESGWKGVRAYRLDLSYTKGINGINIGADAGDTRLPKGFASVLSLQCSFECFMGDADIRFVKEAGRILSQKGRYAIAPLYLEDIHFVSTSPYCDQANVKIDPGAKKVWRDDAFRAPFGRHYSPEVFFERIYSQVPADMSGRVLYFSNLDEIMRHYPSQRVYCFFMFLCEKRKKEQMEEREGYPTD